MAISTAIRNGWAAFREVWLNADPLQSQQAMFGEFDAWSRWEARQSRYDLYWSLWQANVFRDLVHRWSPALKSAFGLYDHTRTVFSPVHRLTEFGVGHIHGGRLDPEAGDGESNRSALPIEAENDAIRPAIARLWRDSKWQQRKSVWTRYGVCLGDAPLLVEDDPERQRVTLRVIHPGHLKWVDRDSDGNVLSYIVEKWRYDPRRPAVKDLNPTVDPRGTQVMVKYNEEAFLDGGKVTYRTYLGGALFDWRGATGDGGEMPAEWTVPYPFIPLVVSSHIDAGLAWGVAEPHALVSKAFEVDDLASGLTDQIRKRIRAPKLLSGMAAPKGPPFPARDPALDFASERSRGDVPFLYGPEGARVHDLTNDLDVPGVSGHIKAIIEELERDYPELRMDIQAAGDHSGRALRVARQQTETKIQERRSNYDAATVQAQKFALAIGSVRGYPDYAGLDTDPHDGPGLEHAIAHRPVFAPDPLDDIEEGSAFWAMVGTAVKAGMPLEIILKREGWGDEEVAEVMNGRAAQAADEMKRRAAEAVATGKTTATMPDAGTGADTARNLTRDGDRPVNSGGVPDGGQTPGV